MREKKMIEIISIRRTSKKNRSYLHTTTLLMMVVLIFYCVAELLAAYSSYYQCCSNSTFINNVFFPQHYGFRQVRKRAIRRYIFLTSFGRTFSMTQAEKSRNVSNVPQGDCSKTHFLWRSFLCAVPLLLFSYSYLWFKA